MTLEDQNAKEQPNVYKKDRDQSRKNLVPSPLGVLQALTESLAGVTRALTCSLESFSQELDETNIMALGLDNCLIAASVTANTRFLEEVAKISRRAYDDLRSSAEQRTGQRGADLDYERLASLIADRLSQRESPGVHPKS